MTQTGSIIHQDSTDLELGSGPSSPVKRNFSWAPQVSPETGFGAEIEGNGRFDYLHAYCLLFHC